MNIGVVDIGGTFIKSGLFTDGSLTHCAEIPSNSAEGGAAVVKNAVKALEALGPFDRIGVSTAGQVDPERGCIRYANPNIPGYMGTELRGILQKQFHVPVAVENDVKAAAVGEAFYGAAASQKVKNFACLTFGTGIGGAFFIDGRLFRGSTGSAGEVGYLTTHTEKIHPGASLMAGAYETFASTGALVRAASAVDSRLDSGKKIFAALDRPEIRRIVDGWIDEIIYGLTGIIHIMNPSLVILGGGVMNAPYILPQLRQRLPRFLSGGHLPVELRQAALGNRAGLMGAGYLAMTMPETI